jgi:hypothetical protein
MFQETVVEFQATILISMMIAALIQMVADLH